MSPRGECQKAFLLSGMSGLEKSRIECLTKWADDNKIKATETQVYQIVKTTMDFRKNNLNYFKKQIKKEQQVERVQQVERLALTFPSQDELFTHIVHSALKPSKFR